MWQGGEQPLSFALEILRSQLSAYRDALMSSTVDSLNALRLVNVVTVSLTSMSALEFESTRLM